MNETIVTKANVFPAWMFFPMYPFELPQDLTGRQPFLLPDYIVSGELQTKLFFQLGVMGTAIYLGLKK